MPLEAIPYLLQPVVHGLCQSGFHEQCKMFEDWNFKAEFPCACPECNHPFPEITDEMREAARAANNKTDSSEKSRKQLDYASIIELASRDTPEEASDSNPAEEDEPPEEEKEADVATKTKKSETKDTKAKANGRARGALEESVQAITDLYEDGKIDLPEGKTLTPHTIANLIQEKEGLEKAPSTGAVNAVLKRWDEKYGFALTHDKPYAFKRYSAAGKKQGLDALKEKHREKMKAERAAEKES